MTPDREAIDTAKGLTGALDNVAAELKRLRAYGKTNRHLIVVTFASIAVDVVLTVLLVFVYGTAHSASQVAAAEHSNLLAACTAGNQTRAEQIQLWDHLAKVATPPPHLTKRQIAANRKEVAELLAYVRKIFAAKDCQRVYATSGPGK